MVILREIRLSTCILFIKEILTIYCKLALDHLRLSYKLKPLQILGRNINIFQRKMNVLVLFQEKFFRYTRVFESIWGFSLLLCSKLLEFEKDSIYLMDN